MLIGLIKPNFPKRALKPPYWAQKFRDKPEILDLRGPGSQKYWAKGTHIQDPALPERIKPDFGRT